MEVWTQGRSCAAASILAADKMLPPVASDQLLMSCLELLQLEMGREGTVGLVELRVSLAGKREIAIIYVVRSA